jgi:hypothetical protein
MTWNPVGAPPAPVGAMLRYAQPSAASKPCPACPACPADPVYPATRLLLSGDGANGGTVFTDSSVVPKTPTRVGGTVTSTTQIKFGTASLLFNGTTDALSFANDRTLNLAVGDFTIESWIYLTSLATERVILQKDQTFGSTFPSYYLSVTASGALVGLVGTGNGATYNQSLASAAGLITTGAWRHVAFTRDDLTLRLFIDGALVKTATQTGTAADGGKALLIGRFPSGGGTADDWWAGHLDDLRITRGVARYTASFSAPTAALPAHS